MALHLLAVLLLPLAAAPLAALLGRRGGYGVVVATAVAQGSLALLSAPDDILRIGGVTLLVSPMVRFFLPLLLIALVVTTAFAESRTTVFLSAALLIDGSVTGVLMVDNPFLASLFLELAGVVGLFLLPRNENRSGTATAGAKYLTLTVISAVLLLSAFSLIETYRVGGQNRILAQIVLALLTIGIGLRLAAFPFHLWLPGLAETAPPAAVAFVCTVINASSMALAISTFSNSPWLLQDDRLRLLLAGGAAVGVLGGSVLSIFQNDLRRLVAYGTVAEVGYTLLGISWSTQASVAAGLYALVTQILGVVLLWFTIDQIERRAGAGLLGIETGLAKPLPVTAFGFFIGGLTAAGFPLLAGFPGRWQLGRLLAEAGPLWSAAVLGASALLLFAYLRAFRSLFLGPPPEALLKPESRTANGFIIIMALLSLTLGLQPGLLLEGLNTLVEGLPFLR